MRTEVDEISDEIYMEVVNIRRDIKRLYDLSKGDPFMITQVEQMLNTAWQLHKMIIEFSNQYHNRGPPPPELP
jgi:hypothetical protein